MLLFRNSGIEQFFSFFGKSEDFLENPVKVNVVNQISGCDNAEKKKYCSHKTTIASHSIGK